MISHVELLLLLYFLTTSGEIWSWRQAEKCDLHIYKKQPHKVGKFATCKFYLSLSIFSLFLKASFAITGSWESYSGCQMLSCAVWTSTKFDIRKWKWTSIVQVRVNVWGKDARYCCKRNCFFFVYTVCSIAWYMQWQVLILFSCTTHNTMLPSGLSPIFTTLGSLISHGTCI